MISDIWNMFELCAMHCVDLHLENCIKVLSLRHNHCYTTLTYVMSTSVLHDVNLRIT